MNIFREDEPHRGYTEAYEVKFWAVKPENGYMGKRTITYFAKNSRCAHDSVERRWRSDFRGKKVKLISIIYQ